MFLQIPLNAVFPSIKLPCIIFVIIPFIPKNVYCLTCILFLVTILSYQINGIFFMTFKIDFTSLLVFNSYKPVSFCYAAANLIAITTTFVCTRPCFQRVEFGLNQIDTQLTGPMKRQYRLWNEYALKVFVHITQVHIFPDDTVERIHVNGMSLKKVLHFYLLFLFVSLTLNLTFFFWDLSFF